MQTILDRNRMRRLILIMLAYVAILMGFVICMAVFFPVKAHADGLNPLEELRYCGQPHRDSKGNIIRSSRPLIAFQSWHPCPSTGKRTGACPGWAINHVVPLACGGCDAVFNMQWMPNDMKSGAGPHHEDRFERKVYGAEPPIADTPECTYVTPERTIK